MHLKLTLHILTNKHPSTDIKSSISYYWMYSLDFVHDLTSSATPILFTSLDVDVYDPSSTTPKTLKYSNFVVGDSSTEYQLGPDLCFKTNFDDTFSIRRNGVMTQLQNLDAQLNPTCALFNWSKNKKSQGYQRPNIIYLFLADFCYSPVRCKGNRKRKKRTKTLYPI